MRIITKSKGAPCGAPFVEGWEGESIGDEGLELLGLCNHLLQLADGGDAVAEVLDLVDLDELRLQVGGNAVTELLDGVNASGFEQLGKLAGDALDAEKVSMVRPLEDELLADACGLSHCYAALLAGAFLQQVFGCLYTGFVQLGCIYFADSFYFDNLVTHKYDF